MHVARAFSEKPIIGDKLPGRSGLLSLVLDLKEFCIFIYCRFVIGLGWV